MNSRSGPRQQDTTVYNYTLLSRIGCPPWMQWLYYLIPVMAAAYMWLAAGRKDWLAFGFSLVLVQALHYLIISVQAAVRREGYLKKWSFSLRGLWFGLLPNGNTPVRRLWDTQLHLIGIGTAFLVLPYPWLSGSTMLYLWLFHIWLLLPRLIMLLAFLKKSRSGLVKINGHDTSYYLQ